MATAEGGYRTRPWRNDDSAKPDRGGDDWGEANGIDRVLAVYGPTNVEKIQRHIVPLSDVAETTLVCTEADPEVDSVRQIAPPSTGFRILDLLFMSVLVFLESVRGEYDAVVSVSLVPHGCLALFVARLWRLPVHLGIIGGDIDVHAGAWYGRPVRALVRQFDAVTVPGPTHRRRLHESIGLPEERTAILANPIDVGRFPETRDDSSVEYDLLWVGRFTDEKRPLLFVDVVAELADRDPSLRAVMLGDGPLADEVEKRIDATGLQEVLSTPGWVDDPTPWYGDAAVFTLTSERDALPLTLVEAMAAGTVPVAPAVGNVPDLLVDDWNGVLVEPASGDGFAAAIEELLSSPRRRARLGSNAFGVRDRFSYAAAADDWRHVTHVLGRARG